MKILKTFLLSSLLAFLLAGQSSAEQKADSYLLQGTIQVMPEVTTKVSLSNRDINRITCPNGLLLKDAVYSTEKGISLKIEGSNAFVKYLIVKDAMSGENKYRSDPAELYIVCGNNNQIFTLIGTPGDIPAQHIQLVSKEEAIKKSLSLFEGMPFERKVIMVIQKVYTNDIPSAFTVKKIDKSFSVFKDIGITLNRIVVAEGEGMQIKEYILKLQESFKGKSVQLNEKDFLLPELTENPVAITLESQTLKKGRLTRLFIVDRTGNRENVNDFQTE